MKASTITSIIAPIASQVVEPEADILHLLTDSRHLSSPTDTLFFAIPTQRNSGTRYIADLYRQGVRSFIVPSGCSLPYTDVNLWVVSDVVAALQAIAASHRRHFSIPVVGITGSNGKTIVKDWLVQMLSADRRVVASPKSYNSQIGVPLSVWQLSQSDQIALFEAGISLPGEMSHLQQVIQPTIGIFTTIGHAHDENFSSRNQKIAEKLKLFTHCQTLIYCADHADIHSAVSHLHPAPAFSTFTWGRSLQSDLLIESLTSTDLTSTFHLLLRSSGTHCHFTIPFLDRASQENAMHCIALMLHLGYFPSEVARRCARLTPIEMRLELSECRFDSLLINDSYSLDLNSLAIALDYLSQVNQFPDRTVILSDMLQTGIPEADLYARVAQMVSRRGVTRFIGIGEALSRCQGTFSQLHSSFFASTQEFLDHFDPALLAHQTILLKGARLFSFERIAKILQRKNHETIMEVNLDALTANLNYFRSRLRPTTRLMAMVKASSYGAGRVEVASALQFNHVDYLTVAYADEGVELRRGGITLPIMVMNPEEASFDDIVAYRLEPDIYSFRILNLFADHIAQRQALTPSNPAPYPIHIEFDTGMHRLGFAGHEVQQLRRRLSELASLLEVKSVFSHLACSEDPSMDSFTQAQISRLHQWSDGMPGIKHILNSSGITRFPEAQLDMVRLGIGLYGISPDPEVQSHLQQVSRLTTRISQLKAIATGDTVGYNCRWQAQRPSQIAILPIGYADGLHRGLGYGRGRVLIAGHQCPIIGSVCMDMCFVDATDVACAEGDRAIIFGEGDLLQANAAAAGTIPYELLTAVSPRVKRVYYHC
ncbi:MAG: bifunctional UDP-N-acetylmuramoyl-tripeptide:D-alanyl-D-alanine ligase/alanine racemase [Bacteroidales bacterium]|nr:bifunctional UDP-N-acetylmuramoyl-tripeptide:D-alanyl-D-alanine ligase/alanine racemase [Bacteroidales bacterium]